MACVLLAVLNTLPVVLASSGSALQLDEPLFKAMPAADVVPAAARAASNLATKLSKLNCTVLLFFSLSALVASYSPPGAAVMSCRVWMPLPPVA